MPTDQASLELLAHFDRVVDDVADDVCELPASAAGPTRGVGWVLRWFAALVVLCYSTSVLAEFAYCVAAEQMLVRAARAGVFEATLPRATVASIHQSVWRRLQGSVATQSDVKLSLLTNDVLVGKQLSIAGGDKLVVVLAMPAQAVMPRWIRALTLWRGDSLITARAEQTIPARELRSRVARD